MAWITADDLRGAAGAKQAFDQDKFEEAAEIACQKVEELCGPIAWATITGERVEVDGADEVCLKYRVTRGLTDVSAYYPAVTYLLSDWLADGQVLKRKTRMPIYADLSVSYLTGYYDDTVVDAKAPFWARAMAKMIGHQYLRVGKRYRMDADDDLSQTHFIIPAPALEVGRNYLITQVRIGNG